MACQQGSPHGPSQGQLCLLGLRKLIFANISSSFFSFYHRQCLIRSADVDPLLVRETKQVVIKLIPGYDDDALIALVEHCAALRAVVLELYGTGNSPSRREGFVKFIKVRSFACACVHV